MREIDRESDEICVNISEHAYFSYRVMVTVTRTLRKLFVYYFVLKSGVVNWL